MFNVVLLFVIILSCFDWEFPTKPSENLSVHQEVPVQDSATIVMRKVLSDAIGARGALKPLPTTFIYSVDESRGKEIMRCSTDLFNDLVLAIEQTREAQGYQRVFTINREVISFEDISIVTSIEGYPVPITGYLDCYEMRLYRLLETDTPYFLVESVPMNWTGRMSAEYCFYQLIDPAEKIGIQTVATSIND